MKPRLTEQQRSEAARASHLIDEALLEECDCAFFVASGPGGQHRNKTESGVRLHHIGTGTVVRATERRSQHQNLKIALERLREKLIANSRTAKPRKKTRPTTASKIRRLNAKRHLGFKKRERGGWKE